MAFVAIHADVPPQYRDAPHAVIRGISTAIRTGGLVVIPRLLEPYYKVGDELDYFLSFASYEQESWWAPAEVRRLWMVHRPVMWWYAFHIRAISEPVLRRDYAREKYADEVIPTDGAFKYVIDRPWTVALLLPGGVERFSVEKLIREYEWLLDKYLDFVQTDLIGREYIVQELEFWGAAIHKSRMLRGSIGYS